MGADESVPRLWPKGTDEESNDVDMYNHVFPTPPVTPRFGGGSQAKRAGSVSLGNVDGAAGSARPSEDDSSDVVMGDEQPSPTSSPFSASTGPAETRDSRQPPISRDTDTPSLSPFRSHEENVAWNYRSIRDYTNASIPAIVCDPYRAPPFQRVSTEDFDPFAQTKSSPPLGPPALPSVTSRILPNTPTAASRPGQFTTRQDPRQFLRPKNQIAASRLADHVRRERPRLTEKKRDATSHFSQFPPLREVPPSSLATNQRPPPAAAYAPPLRSPARKAYEVTIEAKNQTRQLRLAEARRMALHQTLSDRRQIRRDKDRTERICDDELTRYQDEWVENMSRDAPAPAPDEEDEDWDPGQPSSEGPVARMLQEESERKREEERVAQELVEQQERDTEALVGLLELSLEDGKGGGAVAAAGVEDEALEELALASP